MRIVWDEARCASLGMCEAVAPEHFEIGDDGALHVLQPDPPPGDRLLLEDAVAACPTAALTLVEHPPNG